MPDAPVGGLTHQIRNLWLLAVIWTAAVGAYLAWNVSHDRVVALQGVQNEARALANEFVDNQRWLSEIGSLYVPETDKTPANPYLATVPDRDIVSPSGTSLTLINHAHVLKTLAREHTGVAKATVRLTSRDPLNPSDVADAWERTALERLEAGATEITMTELSATEPRLRYMAPVIARGHCGHCHTTQRWPEGAVAGGISLTIPLTAAFADAKRDIMVESSLVASLWLLATAAIWLLAHRLGRSQRQTREAEAGLTRSTSFLRAVLDSIEDQITIIDPTTFAILDANRAHWNAFGVAAESAQGRTCQAVGHGNDATCTEPEHRCPVATACRSGTTASSEHVHRNAEGEERQVVVSAYPVRTPTGEIRHVVRVVRDVTEHKKLEAKFLQAQKMEAIGRLAGGVAHDMNNVLSVILNDCALLLEDLPPKSPIVAELEEIRSAGERASALTKQLLAFSRKQPFRPLAIDVNKVVKSIAKMISRLVGENVKVQLELADDLGAVVADPAHLEQVIMNLAVNARDAMPKGGEIRIKTDRVTLTDADCAGTPTARPGNFVRLALGDTGTGMDAATLARIFEPFFTTKGPAQGTGLGLSVVYGIVEQQGGWISVDSRVGAGSTFSVHLPQSERLSAPAPEPSTLVEKGHGETVLLVEDDEQVLNVTKRILALNGYQVVTARSAKDALFAFGSATPSVSLILSDVVLPDESGVTLVQKLRLQSPGVPFVLMSGYNDEGAGIASATQNGGLFIQKPYRSQDLLQLLRRALAAPPTPATVRP
ncbi:MAG: DUF3365 domain-containing protein [Deltaproteobacteria bacterium]|nr:DUF3365 domain-containing protein [Deltaproteobacteria bacterium]